MSISKVSDYKRWILDQTVEGCAIKEGANAGVVLLSDVARGAVNFYDIDGQIVVELRLEDTTDGSPLFFLHFEFGDMERAQELFFEMTGVLAKRLNREVEHVLLCCTCGMTTTFFANKLNELAVENGLGYDFTAKSVEEAKKSGMEFVAVLLAPQVGHQLKAVREALPGVMVMELPGAIFGAYDANGAMQLLIDGLRKARKAARRDLRFAREFDRTKSILAISYVLRVDEPTVSYQVLKSGEVVSKGTMIRTATDPHTILDDLVATLRVEGHSIGSFDAVGIAIPGVVNNGAVSVGDEAGQKWIDIAERLKREWGVPVFVDNGAAAAAAGCYVSQNEWDDVVFHAQPIGAAECEQGYVLGGKLRTGRKGFGGSVSHLARWYDLSMDLDEAVWRYDGMRELLCRYLGTTICTIAPQAIFVWCDYFPDMEDLIPELEEIVPAEAIPELVEVFDYDSLILLGEMSLCLQRLVKE